MQSNTAVSTDIIPKPRWSCSWTCEINKLFVSRNERLNSIILERTIEFNTYPASKFHGKRIQPYLWDREQMEERTKYTWPTYVLTCSPHVITHVPVTVPVYWPWHAPAKIKRGGHFGVLTGMCIFQNITLHRATNSAKSHAKIRFALHFVERNIKSRIWDMTDQFIYKPCRLDIGPCGFSYAYQLTIPRNEKFQLKVYERPQI